MEILGSRKFVEVPGSEKHELPPLMVRMAPYVRRLDRVMDMASDLIEQEDMIPAHPRDLVAPGSDPGRGQLDVDRRKTDLALHLVDQYVRLVLHWQWGDSILAWIRQCETTFEARVDLRNLLRADLWPHASRSSFVMLLEDKAVQTRGVGIEKAVGLRLTFRQPPPLRCFSDQFLFYLNSSMATSAYKTWARMSPSLISALPPERFNFQVVNMSFD